MFWIWLNTFILLCAAVVINLTLSKIGFPPAAVLFIAFLEGFTTMQLYTIPSLRSLEKEREEDVHRK